ncbi:MAG: hypothetical protein IT340_06055 [Chloroflexi bacterium]|nr:hypothetical protein [Chloroflexota bacterium]
MSALIAITGIQAAVVLPAARRLAERFDRSVHVEADARQRMIVASGT